MESYLKLANKLTKFLSYSELKSRLLAMGVIFDVNNTSKSRLKFLYLQNIKKPFRTAFIRNKLESDAQKHMNSLFLSCALDFSSAKKRLSLSLKKYKKIRIDSFNSRVQKKLVFGQTAKNGKQGFKYYEKCKYLGSKNFHKTISLGNSNVKLSMYHFNSNHKSNKDLRGLSQSNHNPISFRIHRIPCKIQELKSEFYDYTKNNGLHISSQYSTDLSSLHTEKYKVWCLNQREEILENCIKSNILNLKRRNPQRSSTYQSELVFSALIMVSIITILILTQAKHV